MLEELIVHQCDQLKNFLTLGRDPLATDVETTYTLEKFFPNLEKLSLCKESIMQIRQAPIIQAKLLQKVKFLKFEFFDDDSDRFPYRFLQKELLPHVKELQVSSCNFEEIFTFQISNMDGYSDMLFSQLKTLQLSSLLELNSIGLEHTLLPKSLETLKVEDCPCLINLAPSTVSFSNLKALIVWKCDGLVYLFTSSTAKSLVLLEELTVSECESIQQIMAEEGNEPDLDEITFKKLKTLSLDSLKSLGSFHRGNSTMNFPSLEHVTIHQCLRMKFFSHGTINTIELLRVSAKPSIDYGNSHPEYSGMDLNVRIGLILSSQLATYAHDVWFLFLDDHPELQEIWQCVIPVPDGAFSNLKYLTMNDCQSLTHVIPSHLVPFLCNLECLTVRDCNAIKAIFQVGPMSTLFFFALKRLTLQQLPNLEHVWNEDLQEILSFQSLQHVYVDGCKSLKSLFQASMAIGKLENLESLIVQDCKGLVEIVARDETASQDVTRNLIMFPSLTMLKLWKLPKLRCIYPGLNNLEWPNLYELIVHKCHQLKNFPVVAQDHLPIQVEVTATLEKVFPSLENLSLSKENIMKFWQEPKLLQRVKFLVLKFFHDDLDEFPYRLFQKEMLPHVEMLEVSSSNFKDIFISQKSSMNGYDETFFLQLKTLELRNLSNLSSIGFEHTSLPGNLETLKVEDCPCLINLTPSTVSFSNLRGLYVIDCPILVYLFTSTTAKSLAFLEELSISGCGSIQKIVAEEGDESNQDEITFRKLKTLSLESLESLGSFYPGNSTINFPSLELVTIYECPIMKIFSYGVIKGTDNLRVSAKHLERLQYYCGMDLNVLTELIFSSQLAQFACDVQYLKLGDYPELQELWIGAIAVPNGGFSQLNTLIVDGCHFLSNNVIPFHLLPILSNLEELHIRNCHSINAIFDVGPMPTQEILIFQVLQLVYVYGCSNLKSLFPASMAQGKLERLEILQVQKCEGLVEIIPRDKTISSGGTTTNCVIFPGLTNLELRSLPKLKYICPGLNNLEWPMLKVLEAYHCDQLKIFPTKDHNHPSEREAIVSFEKVFPNLEQLSLSKKNIMNLLHWQRLQFQSNFLQRVRLLGLMCFHDDSDRFPYGFFQRESLHNIEKLRVACSNFKEIFTSEKPNVDCHTKILFSQFKGLELFSLWKLESIGLEQSWVSPLPENLESLKVGYCSCLINLVPTTVSFSHLRDLFVFQCYGLVHLFTSSTAESLAQLENLSIRECNSIQEIVTKEGDEPDGGVITFTKLKTLYLASLPCLDRFFTGNHNLEFPSMEEVSIFKCSQLKIFCQADIYAPVSVTIQSDRDLSAIFHPRSSRS